MSLSLIDRIITPGNEGFYESLERLGDFMAAPGRLFFGRTFSVEKATEKIIDNGNHNEITGERLVVRQSIVDLSIIYKIVAVVFFPFSLLFTLFGLLIKEIALVSEPQLARKYSLDSYPLPIKVITYL